MNRFILNQKGSVTIYVAGMMTVLILILNVVVADIGRVFLNQEKATVAADAAAGAALGIAYDVALDEILDGLEGHKKKMDSMFTAQRNEKSVAREGLVNACADLLAKLVLSEADAKEGDRLWDDILDRGSRPGLLTDFLGGKINQPILDDLKEKLRLLDEATQALAEIRKQQKQAATEIAGFDTKEKLSTEQNQARIKELLVFVWDLPATAKQQPVLAKFIDIAKFKKHIESTALAAVSEYAAANDVPNANGRLFVHESGQFAAEVRAYKATAGRVGTIEDAETRVRSF